jgi:acylphosphatase
VVHGSVQGVGFRWSCSREAERLGVRGWVRNRPDGTVEAVAEGDAAAVEELVAWLRHGPRFSDVSHVEVVDEEPAGLASFEIQD